MSKHFHSRFFATDWNGMDQAQVSQRREWSGRGRYFGRRRGDTEQPRNDRGDIKFILLELLVEEARCGYQLIKELETRYGSFYGHSPSLVYPTLQMLEEGEYLTRKQVESKRIYTVTESGRQLLAGQEQQTPVTRPSQTSGNPKREVPRTLLESSTVSPSQPNTALQLNSPSQKTGLLLICSQCARDSAVDNFRRAGEGTTASEELRAWLKSRFKAEGLSDELRAVSTSCLGVCPRGRVAVVLENNAGRQGQLLVVDPKADREALYVQIKQKLRGEGFE